MDTELRELAADRLCEDYNGSVDVSERDLYTKFGNQVDKITYDDNQFHFWTKCGEDEYDEVFPCEDDIDYILDDFYAWY